MEYPNTQPLIEHLHARLQPVIDQHPDGKATFNGSSVLLQVADRFFFASAAHVFKAPPAGGNVHIVGDRNLRLRLEDVVGGTDASSPHPATGRIDVAFVEMSADEVAILGGVAVQMDEVDVDESLKPKGPYLAIGYPGSKTKFRYPEGILRVNPFAYHSGRADPQTYVALGLFLNTHLVLDYKDDGITWMDGVEHRGPYPKGMSGGGIWRVQTVDPVCPESSHAKLVAIITEYYGEHHALVATRIGLLLEGIRFRYPELSDHIPRMSAVKLNAKRGYPS